MSFDDESTRPDALPLRRAEAPPTGKKGFSALRFQRIEQQAARAAVVAPLRRRSWKARAMSFLRPALAAMTLIAGCAPAAFSESALTRTAAPAASGPAPRAVAPDRQRFMRPESLVEAIARKPADIPETVSYVARLAENPDAFAGARKVESSQIGLLYGSTEGRAFLEAPFARALARGEPPNKCAALSVGIVPDSDPAGAARAALEECFARLEGQPDCGCRVIAEGDHLLAPAKEFAYAMGVSARIVDVLSGRDMQLVAEERPVEGRPDARRLWLIGLEGAEAMLHVEPDGRAALLWLKDGRRWDGRVIEEGFRRGRVARRAFLKDSEGRPMAVLVGFEPEEVGANRAALLREPTAPGLQASRSGSP